jgi:hypothetical protein
MIIAITIWIIGWMFTTGFAVAIDRGAAIVFLCGISAWPWMLGLMIGETFAP